MHTTSKHPPAARRLVLRPGVHVLRRDADLLQVGLDPERALLLPDRDDVRALLAALTDPAAAVDDERYDGATIRLLADSGLLVDADVLLPLAPDGPTTQGPAGSRAGVAALAAHDGDASAALLMARACTRVELLTCGSPEAVGVASSLSSLLTTAGLPHVTADHGAAPAEHDASPPAGLVGVLVAVGEPDREHLDAWMRAAVPHLLLRLVEGRAVLGPFVEPGRTACLRCVDAHHTDVDPSWALLVVQYAAAVSRGRVDTLPEPVDPMLATLAAAWTARELVSHAEGRRPATASTTLRLDPHLTALETHRWLRHPACGCSWS